MAEERSLDDIMGKGRNHNNNNHNNNNNRDRSRNNSNNNNPHRNNNYRNNNYQNNNSNNNNYNNNNRQGGNRQNNVCRNFQQGNCRFGDRCNFSHSNDNNGDGNNYNNNRRNNYQNRQERNMADYDEDMQQLQNQKVDWDADLDFDKYGEFIKRNLANKKYGIIFLGTNDYEKDFQQIDEQLQKHKSEEDDKVKTAMLVSNGWIYVLDSLFKTHKNIENVVLYDYNPAMLIVYDLIWKMIRISKTRQEFITNCFCREFDEKINDNSKMLEYLKEPYSRQILKSVYRQLDEIDEGKKTKSSTAFKEIIGEYGVKSVETRQLYPLYVWDEKQMYIDGRKMHTTQKSDRVFDFFTTFYFGVLSPFMENEQYINFRERVLKCKFNFVLSNIYHILGNTFLKDQKEKHQVIYIDGIDEETCHYLKNTREFLFDKIQEFQFESVKIISTKSGITKITPDDIKRDQEFKTYPYKRELNKGEQQPDEYPQEMCQLEEELNNQE